MSQADRPVIQNPKNAKPGCSGTAIWVALIGFGGFVIIGLLLMGYTFYQIQTEDLSSLFGNQAPEIEQLPDEPPPDLVPEGESDSIPIGTYVGSTDFPDRWTQYPGTDFVNEITVIIANNGAVTGSLSVVREGEALVAENNCITFTDFDVSGAPSGQLTDVKGTLVIQMVYYFETRYTEGCSSATNEFTETYELSADVLISGDQMTGTVPDFFSFEATRR